MIVDTSAVVAAMQLEPEGTAILRLLSRSERTLMSAGNYLECGIVIDGNKDAELSAELDGFIGTTRVEIAPVTETQARIARQAYRDFGKGSGHPAKLNYGDCFAYALAKDTGRPLLYKGDDFFHAGFERLV